MKKSITVDAPVELVFDYLADFERHAEWNDNDNLKEVISSEGPVAEGFTFERRGLRGVVTHDGHEMPYRLGVEIYVLEFEPHKRLPYEVT